MREFKHLKIPNGWEHYWTRYPQGFTIMESLIEWVSQSNSVMDNINDLNKTMSAFIDQFDTKLQPFVVGVLDNWLMTGVLEDIINVEILGNKSSIRLSEEEPTGKVDNSLFWYKVEEWHNE